jgi:uroporphyrin-III C-methyltransferase
MTGFAALDAIDFPAFEPGTVWLVGAGPGAPGLLSLLGYHALQTADVIVYDALVSDTLLAIAPAATERVYAGKRGGKPSETQAAITDELIEWAEAGRRVLRLKGGDPMMFGRGAEEALALAARGIDFRIVPGITAGIGGLAYAGIPVTYRETNHAVVFLTGHDESGAVPASVDWNAVATAAPVIVMYMAASHLISICEKLIAAGRPADDWLAVVCKATLPGEYTIDGTLGTAAHIVDMITTPAVVVVGPVGALRFDLSWRHGALADNPIG